MPVLSPIQTRHLRLRAQRLLPTDSDTHGDATEFLRELSGVQGQDPLAALLVVQIRSRGLVAPEVERARVQDRSIVSSWCLRGTLRLLATEDLGWLTTGQECAVSSSDEDITNWLPIDKEVQGCGAVEKGQGHGAQSGLG
jgi:hypothetical protein